MVVVIIVLYALITVNFVASWSHISTAFILNGQSFWTVYLGFFGEAQTASWEEGIAAAMSTILTDLYMVCETLLGIHISSPFFSTLDLVLLDGLGTALGCCFASNIFLNFCNW